MKTIVALLTLNTLEDTKSVLDSTGIGRVEIYTDFDLTTLSLTLNSGEFLSIELIKDAEVEDSKEMTEFYRKVMNGHFFGIHWTDVNALKLVVRSFGSRILGLYYDEGDVTNYTIEVHTLEEFIQTHIM